MRIYNKRVTGNASRKTFLQLACSNLDQFWDMNSEAGRNLSDFLYSPPHFFYWSGRSVHVLGELITWLESMHLLNEFWVINFYAFMKSVQLVQADLMEGTSSPCPWPAPCWLATWPAPCWSCSACSLGSPKWSNNVMLKPCWFKASIAVLASEKKTRTDLKVTVSLDHLVTIFFVNQLCLE